MKVKEAYYDPDGNPTEWDTPEEGEKYVAKLYKYVPPPPKKKERTAEENKLIEIKEFFEKLSKAVHCKIYPLVDEYDVFAEKRITKDNEAFKKEIARIYEVNVKFNAVATIDAGYVYDEMTGEERMKMAQKRIEKLENDINQFLTNNKIFGRNLQAKIVNGKFRVIVTKRDNTDDGNDEFGVQLAIRFSYKK